MSASTSSLRPITEVAAELGIPPTFLVPYGRTMAKVDHRILERPRERPGKGKLVLVSAISPTPAGEGKTTTSIGLAQGLRRLGQSVCLALREPSLGPCLGAKGGGTGGGKSKLEPSDRINLHFTGDFHAITSANNLLAALIDNHLHFGNELGLDTRRIAWRRVMDMNDRALREIVLGLGGPSQGVPREGGFDITAASEIMAIAALSEGFEDLRKRLDRILVGTTRAGEPVQAGQLGGTGALLTLLRDVLDPNLVQSTEGVPAIVHCGPFANIAHGCNSVIGTRTALNLADWAVTEGGFGFDLGAEKFFDIKARGAGIDVAAVVLVTTVKALKMHGGIPVKRLGEVDPAAVKRGLPNLEKHVESAGHFGFRPIIALNRFATDADVEIAVVRDFAKASDLAFAESSHFANGGAGAEQLAKVVMEHALPEPRRANPVYALDDKPADKIRAIATKIYGAKDVYFTPAAESKLAEIERLGYGKLPICMAKTQKSLSDDEHLVGRPTGFTLTVRGFEISAGAGFIVALTGEMLRMPGLPREPLANALDVKDGEILNLS